MKRLLLVWAMVMLVALATVACTSSRSSPNSNLTELTETITEACGFYQKAKPHIVAYSEWAKANWEVTVTLPDGTTVDLITPEQKALLAELNVYLPKLDEAGGTICLLAGHNASSRDSPAVNWDRVLAVTLKVATTAIQLKAEGVI